METENSLDPKHDKNSKTCGLCNQKDSKYCCPRCGILYCSLDCYKSEKHIDCSESFYRDCVNEELAAHHGDDESRYKMIEILKKLQANDQNEDIEINDDGTEEPIDSDDNEEIDLHERVKDLDLNDADAVWNALTEDEKNEFEALLNNGDVGAIMQQWEPWWLYKRENKLVEDVDTSFDDLSKCPELKEVPKFETLTTVQPSKMIWFNITNVLASYAFVMRYFNGELEPFEGVTYLLNICSNLDSNIIFEDLETAIESVAQKCLQSELIQTDEVSVHIMKQDIILILEGPSENNKKYFCKAALSHIHRLLMNAKLEQKSKNSDTIKERKEFSKKFPEHRKEHLPKIDVSKIKKCIKKVEYYLSYVESYEFGMKLF